MLSRIQADRRTADANMGTSRQVGETRPAVAALLATLALVLTGAFVGMFILWRVAVFERAEAVQARDDEKTAKDETEVQRDRAEESLDQAYSAGEEQFNRVAQERLLKVPGMEGLRKELLLQAITFFERFYQLEGGTQKVRNLAARNRRAGDALELLGKRSDARQAYARSIALLTGLVSEAPGRREYRYTLAGTRNNFGFLLQASDEPQHAEREYILAIGLLEKLQSDYPLEASYQSDLATAYDNFAGLLRYQPGRDKETNQNYQKSLGWWRKLHAHDAKNPDYQMKLARVLNNFGLWQLMVAGNFVEAEGMYDESLLLWTELANKKRDDPDYIDGKATALINLAVAWSGESPAKAEETYREAIAIEEKLVPDWPRVADYRQNLARSYTNLSLLLARDSKRIEEAADLRQKAIPHWEKLVDLDPHFADYQVGLTGCLHSEAQYQLRILGNKEPAIKWGYNAIKKQEEMAASFPQRADLQLLLANGYIDMGQLYGEGGKLDLEKANYQLALKRLDDIQRKSTTLPKGWDQAMADANNNMGTAHALGGDFKGALPWYQKAVQQQRKIVDHSEEAAVAGKFVRYSMDLAKLQMQLKNPAGVSSVIMELAPLLQQFELPKEPETTFTLALMMGRCLPMTSGEDQKRYADQTIRLLEDAVEQGFNNLAEVGNSESFGLLRERRNTNNCLKEWERKASTLSYPHSSAKFAAAINPPRPSPPEQTPRSSQLAYRDHSRGSS